MSEKIQVNFRLRPELIESLKIAADEQRISVTELVSRLLEEGVKSDSYRIARPLTGGDSSAIQLPETQLYAIQQDIQERIANALQDDIQGALEEKTEYLANSLNAKLIAYEQRLEALESGRNTAIADLQKENLEIKKQSA